MIIRPSYTVLSGAAIGLVAGAAVYGAVSSSADQTPAKATVAAVPASADSCAPGLKLEDGVCVVHVVKTVVVPPAAGQGASSPQGSVAASGTSAGSESSASGDDAAEAAEPDADDATEAANEAADDSAVAGAPSDTSSSTPRD
jgi:hypothetical protein